MTFAPARDRRIQTPGCSLFTSSSRCDRCAACESRTEGEPWTNGALPPRPAGEGIAVAISGEIYQDAYLAPLRPESGIYLILKIGGG